MRRNQYCGLARRAHLTRLVLVGMAMAVLAPLSCRKLPAGKETVSFGGSFPNAWPFYVAEEQGYLSRNGLRVIVKSYASFLEALIALNAGEVDLAQSGEYAVVNQAFAGRSMRIIASVEELTLIYLLGRKDRGIEAVADLKGKRIGLVRQSITEFYLGRFLAIHGVDLKEVTLVHTLPADSADALAGGRIEAVITWDPVASHVKARLPGNLSIWPAQNNQALYAVVSARSEWISRHPGTVKRFLKAIDQAAAFLQAQPEKAKAILMRRLKMDDAQMAVEWPEHLFTVSLDESLVIAMKDEARWMLDSGRISERPIPNFLEFVYPDGLEEVNPQAVDIVR